MAALRQPTLNATATLPAGGPLRIGVGYGALPTSLFQRKVCGMATRELDKKDGVSGASECSDIDSLVQQILHPKDPDELLGRLVTDSIPKYVKQGALTEREAEELVRYLLAVSFDRQLVESVNAMLPSGMFRQSESAHHFWRHRRRLRHVLST